MDYSKWLDLWNTDSGIQTFEATLNELLEKRRDLAQDMLHGAADITAAEFGDALRVQG